MKPNTPSEKNMLPVLTLALTLAFAPLAARAVTPPQSTSTSTSISIPISLPLATTTPTPPAMSTSGSTELTKTLPSKKKKASQTVTKAETKLPTKLPAYKGPKRIVIDFEKSQNENQSEHQTTVVVRTPLPLSKALEDRDNAARAQQDSMDKIIHDMSPEGATELSKSETPPVDEPSAAKPEAALPEKVSHSKPHALSSLRQVIAAAPAVTPTPTPAATPSQLSAAPTPTPPAPPHKQNIFYTPGPVPPPERRFVSKGSTDDFTEPTLPEAPPQPLETIEAVPAHVAIITKTSPPAPLTPPSHQAVRRLHLRGAYIDAKYSQLESRLTNGSTSMGLGLSRELSADFESRLAIDVVHGLDQAVTPENIRTVTVRAEAAKFFLPGTYRPFVAGALGYATYNVTSVRSVGGDILTVKRHANGAALLFAPAVGVRIAGPEMFSFDFQVEYLGLMGGEKSSSVGGLSAMGAVGVEF